MSLRRRIEEIKSYMGLYYSYNRKLKLFTASAVNNVYVNGSLTGREISLRGEDQVIEVKEGEKDYDYLLKEYQRQFKQIVERYIEKEREQRKERKEREKKNREKDIISLKESFENWLQSYEGKVLSSKRQNELASFEANFQKFGLEWTYVHSIKERTFKISFSSDDEEEINLVLDRTLNQLDLQDDGESEDLSNELTTVKVEVFDDGFEIHGSTRAEIGSMKANRLGICWLS